MRLRIDAGFQGIHGGNRLALVGARARGFLCVAAIGLDLFNSSLSGEEDRMRALTNRVTAGLGAVTRVKREVDDKVGTNLRRRW